MHNVFTDLLLSIFLGLSYNNVGGCGSGRAGLYCQPCSCQLKVRALVPADIVGTISLDCDWSGQREPAPPPVQVSRPAMDKKKATKGGAKTKGKKGKKTKKKPDKNLTGDAAAEAKKELVTALMAKCNMSEDQVRNIVQKYLI